MYLQNHTIFAPTCAKDGWPNSCVSVSTIETVVQSQYWGSETNIESCTSKHTGPYDTLLQHVLNMWADTHGGQLVAGQECNN